MFPQNYNCNPNRFWDSGFTSIPLSCWLPKFHPWQMCQPPIREGTPGQDRPYQLARHSSRPSWSSLSVDRWINCELEFDFFIGADFKGVHYTLCKLAMLPGIPGPKTVKYFTYQPIPRMLKVLKFAFSKHFWAFQTYPQTWPPSSPWWTTIHCGRHWPWHGCSVNIVHPIRHASWPSSSSGFLWFRISSLVQDQQIQGEDQNDKLHDLRKTWIRRGPVRNCEEHNSCTWTRDLPVILLSDFASTPHLMH